MESFLQHIANGLGSALMGSAVITKAGDKRWEILITAREDIPGKSRMAIRTYASTWCKVNKASILELVMRKNRMKLSITTVTKNPMCHLPEERGVSLWHTVTVRCGSCGAEYTEREPRGTKTSWKSCLKCGRAAAVHKQ